ncbi:hypothetical protein UB43_28640 [Pseudomonas sp. 21]|nr:hypothetical protein UB43_28640 [Pseudomonas sp. 21]
MMFIIIQLVSAIACTTLVGGTYELIAEHATSIIGWGVFFGLHALFFHTLYSGWKLNKWLHENIKSQQKYVLRGRVENFWMKSVSPSPGVPLKWNWQINGMTITHDPMVSGGLRNKNGKLLNTKELKAIQQTGANAEVHLTNTGQPFRFFMI